MKSIKFLKTEDVNAVISEQSIIQFVTKKGITIKVSCSMTSEDFLTVYNQRTNTLTFATGTGAYCKVNKKEIALFTVEPIAPFPEFNSK